MKTLQARAKQNSNRLAEAKAVSESLRSSTKPAATIYGTHWGHESKPELHRFSTWADQFTSATPAQKSRLIHEGVELAKERRLTMSNLIVSNPAAALAAAIPQDVRAELPEEVLAHSERRISGIGNLQVFGITPEKGAEPTMPLIQRQVQLGDQSYQAHTYGVLSRFGTVNDLYMHGVAVGDRIALADSPVRALEAGETVDVSLMADVAYDEARWAALGEEVSIAAAIGRAYENLGPKTMLLIPVEFPDRAGSPWSSTAVRDSRINNIQDYFSTASYGTFTLPTITSAPLQMMDNNTATYANSGSSLTGSSTLRDHALIKSLAAGAGFDPANFDFVCVVINHNLSEVSRLKRE